MKRDSIHQTNSIIFRVSLFGETSHTPNKLNSIDMGGAIASVCEGIAMHDTSCHQTPSQPLCTVYSNCEVSINSIQHTKFQITKFNTVFVTINVYNVYNRDNEQNKKLFYNIICSWILRCPVPIYI